MTERRLLLRAWGAWTAGAVLAPTGATSAALALALVPAGAHAAEADAAQGVRAALERGAAFAVDQLGRPGGFLDNAKVRIPLPGALDAAAKGLRLIGRGAQVDELVTAMNRAAEAAVPQAKSLIVDAARRLTVRDALAVVQGGSTSVTHYFAGQTREPLSQRFLPIVEKATQKVALARKYDAIASKAAGLGLLQDRDANLTRYVTGKALDGLYLMIGEEERKIRADPVGTGSAILRQVFGR